MDERIIDQVMNLLKKADEQVDIRTTAESAEEVIAGTDKHVHGSINKHNLHKWSFGLSLCLLGVFVLILCGFYPVVFDWPLLAGAIFIFLSGLLVIRNASRLR